VDQIAGRIFERMQTEERRAHKSLPEALDEALARINAGESLEACLADYPQHAPALEPLLRTGSLLRTQAELALPPELEVWLPAGARDFAAVAKEFGPASPAQRAELAARLRLWRVRDHGRVSDLAHKSGSLTEQERARAEAVKPLVIHEKHLDAYFPLLPRIEGVSPLLPFYVAEIAKGRTAAAAVKFRHAPYDAVAVVAARDGGRWRVQSIVSMVEH